MGIVAFDMNELAQEVYQLVIAVCHFINGRGDIAQFAFCTDLVEIYRENSAQLLDRSEIRMKIRIQQG